jgi:hypothetical protein
MKIVFIGLDLRGADFGRCSDSALISKSYPRSSKSRKHVKNSWASCCRPGRKWELTVRRLANYCLGEADPRDRSPKLALMWDSQKHRQQNPFFLFRQVCLWEVSDYIRLVSGAVWLRHWRTELKKHVLPRLFRPGPVEAPLGHVYLRFGDFGSGVECFLWRFG